MFKRAWDFLSSLTLTFWILSAVTLILLWGMRVTQANFEWFSGLNGTAVQDWVIPRLATHPWRVAWIPILFAAMSLLALNTLACALSRLVVLFRSRRSTPTRRWLLLMAPSAVHICFIIIMTGHLLTFTLGESRRLSLSGQATIQLGDQGGTLRVGKVTAEYYPDSSGLKDRIRQIRLKLSAPGMTVGEVAFLSPLHYRGYHLFLDKSKRRRPDVETTCNKADDFKSAVQRTDPSSGLFLKVVRDPGLPLLTWGFWLILALMIAYYAGYPRRETPRSPSRE